MTTINDLASRALRRLGVIGKGQVASGPTGADALVYIQGQIDDLPGLRKGPWTETILTSAAAYDAMDGERINTAGYAAVITLPETYLNEAGQTVASRDLSRVQILGVDHDQEGLWVWSASRAAWSQVDGLELSDDSPFGPEDDTGLADLLAVNMAPEFGEQATLSAIVVQRAARQMNSFRARFRRSTAVPVDDALVVMSNIGGFSMPDLLA